MFASNYIFEISRLRASKLYRLRSYFKSLNFFRQPFWSHCGVISRKLLMKSRNHNIFEKFKLNRNLQRIPFKMMYNMSVLRYRFSNERWGGGGGGEGALNHLPVYSLHAPAENYRQFLNFWMNSKWYILVSIPLAAYWNSIDWNFRFRLQNTYRSNNIR